jgi:hypothetical protein
VDHTFWDVIKMNLSNTDQEVIAPTFWFEGTPADDDMDEHMLAFRLRCIVLKRMPTWPMALHIDTASRGEPGEADCHCQGMIRMDALGNAGWMTESFDGSHQREQRGVLSNKRSNESIGNVGEVVMPWMKRDGRGIRIDDGGEGFEGI